jgi:transposase
MDNYGTHKHAKVKAWLKRNPRFVSHFVPTSSSWMNLVERWFGHLDNKAIRRGVFLSAADLKASIEAFLKAWNQDPKPFVWTATVESIREKLTRCRRTSFEFHPSLVTSKMIRMLVLEFGNRLPSFSIAGYRPNFVCLFSLQFAIHALFRHCPVPPPIPLAR